MRKQDIHIFKGMQRDLNVLRHNPEYLYDAKNIRITTNDGDTLIALTNEKGTVEVVENGTITGKYLGHCEMSDYVIVFTTTSTDEEHLGTDYIYKLTSSAILTLYEGKLNFMPSNPIEAIGNYETKDIQKIYWIDNRNQPRYFYINAEDNSYSINPSVYTGSSIDTQFDFVPTLSLNETITISRIDGTGIFAPGVIQYAFSYYDKYGRQSNIFYTSLLYYTSHSNRGGKADERVANSFKIVIQNPQTTFDYIRVYSIHRTSLDAVPTVKEVADLSIPNSGNIVFIDDGEVGSTITPTDLLYIGGESILAGTFTQKDNTLFFGDYEITRNGNVGQITCNNSTVGAILRNATVNNSVTTTTIANVDNTSKYYKYTNALGNVDKPIRPGFKNNEHYRLGLQFQHANGKWSEPVFIGDHTMNVNFSSAFNGNQIIQCIFNATLPATVQSALLSNDYKKVRPVCVYPSINDRLVLTQGILCPTVYSVAGRKNSAPFAQSSWFFRPSLPVGTNCIPNFLTGPYRVGDTNGSYNEFRHLLPLTYYDGFEDTGRKGISANNPRCIEIQGSEASIKLTKDGSNTIVAIDEPPDDKKFFVDQSLVTMHSPDVEFDDSFHYTDFSSYKLRIIGASILTATCSDVDIQTSSPAVSDSKGFTKEKYNTGDMMYAGGEFIADYIWQDGIVHFRHGSSGDNYTYEGSDGSDVNAIRKTHYLIHPWHRSGSLNNDETRIDSSAQGSILKEKKMSNLRFSEYNHYFTGISNSDLSKVEYEISDVIPFYSDQPELVKLTNTGHSYTMNYYGNVDTLLSGNLGNLYVMDEYNPSGSFKGQQLLTYLNEDVSKYKVRDHVLFFGNTPIRMKYKSSPHLVFSLKPSGGKTVILPRTQNVPDDSTITGGIQYLTQMFWETNNSESNITIVRIKGIFNSGAALFSALNNTVTLSTDDLVILLHGGPTTDDFLIGTPTNYDENAPAILCSINSYSKTFNGETHQYEGNIVFEQVAPGSTSYYKYGSTYYVKHSNSSVSTTYTGAVEVAENAAAPAVDDIFKVEQATIPNTSVINNAYLLLAELRKDEDISGNANYWGGSTPEALRENLWFPAGEALPLGSSELIVPFTQGDTWFSRYDCLKTYPFSLEDPNSIVEIWSFMCESRVNLDGRTDRNRGQESNIVMTPLNFNLMNPVYNQHDTFFNYRMLDADYYKRKRYSNSITWSKEKSFAADVDLWTNITLANTLDMDGNKGVVTALRTFNNKIFCFQTNAISNILYNERVQINPNDGVPIEIANSAKVGGKVYIIDSTGCDNKHSLCVAPSGIYFIDTAGREFYKLSDGLASVSGSLGFTNWFRSTESATERTFYDKHSKDLYLVYNNKCLVYSEELGQFMSFMDYDNTDCMFNIGKDFYSIYSNKYWKLHAGNYSHIYGSYRPYYLEFISCDGSIFDKIFSTVETRTDFYNPDGTVNRDAFFDTIQVHNEYQNTTAVNPNAKKKFRIWRVDIPRNNDAQTHNNRIRNPWTKVKFTKTNTTNLKMVSYDMIVDYFV